MEPDLDLAALRRVFIAEAADLLDELERGVIELEGQPDDRELVQRLFRATHTLKGGASSVGLQALGDMGHVLEDLFEDVAAHRVLVTGAVISLLLEAVDAARRMLAPARPADGANAGAAQPGSAGQSPEGGPGNPRSEIVDRLRRARQVLGFGAEGAVRRPGAPSSSQGSGAEGAVRRPPSSSQSDAPTAAAVSLSPGADPPRATSTLRVNVDKLDRMADLLGEIALCRDRLARRVGAIGGAAAAALVDDVEELARRHDELLDAVLSARMVPVGPWLRQHARAVRDLSRAQDKVARLAVDAGDVGLDAAVLERLHDVVIHLVRNAVDHGVEPPAERRRAGKDPCATVTLRAWQEGANVAVQVADDGTGLRRAAIVARARARGDAPDAESLDDEALYRLVFEPGFSTAASVTDISGRGVGLDVVRRRVEALDGSIRVDSAPGAGAAFTMRLPLTLAAVEGLEVAAGGEGYVVPLRAVVECLDVGAAGSASGLLAARGGVLPCVRLCDLLATAPAAAAPRESVVVVVHDGRRVGLVVDALLREGRWVVKPLGPLFRGVPGLAGSTLLGDGRVGLILDVPALVEAAIRGAERRLTHHATQRA